MSGPRGWKGPRGVERHLVHRIHARLRLDQSLATDPPWCSHSRSGHRRVLFRSLLRGTSLPLLAELRAIGRCRTGCQAHRRPHRFHQACKNGAMKRGLLRDPHRRQGDGCAFREGRGVGAATRLSAAQDRNSEYQRAGMPILERQRCRLRAIHRAVYSDLPEEIQLLW